MLRQTISNKWTLVEHSQVLSQCLAQDPQIHTLFVGATTLEIVADKIIELVLADAPELIEKHPIDEWSLLPVLSIAFQATVIKSLLGEPLNQAEQLIIPLTHHVAQQRADVLLSPELANLQDQICMLYQKWQYAQAQQRQAQRNMLG